MEVIGREGKALDRQGRIGRERRGEKVEAEGVHIATPKRKRSTRDLWHRASVGQVGTLYNYRHVKRTGGIGAAGV